MNVSDGHNEAMPRQGCHLMLRFWNDTDGVAQVNYAVMICLVIALIIPAFTCIDRFLVKSFADTSNALSVNRPVAEKKNPTEQSTTHSVHVSSEISSNPFGMAIIGILCVIVVGLVSSHVVSKRKAPSDETEEVTERSLNSESVFLKRQLIYRVLAGDPSAIFDDHLTVEQVMSKRIVTVAPNDAASDVAEMMTKKHFRHVLVCVRGMLIGVISDRDLRKCRKGLSASDLMTASPICVEPDTLVGPAITQLVKNRISCLPVVRDKKVYGVITTTDLLFALQSVLQTLQKLAAEDYQTPNEYAYKREQND